MSGKDSFPKRHPVWTVVLTLAAVVAALVAIGGLGAEIGPQPRRWARRRGVFADCDAVRAAGLAPLRSGTPEDDANRHLDRDGDGIACE